MKTSKNLLSILAFVFAIGTAFAFSAPKNASVSTKDAWDKVTCEIEQVDASCVLTGEEPACIIIGTFTHEAGNPNQICAESTIFREEP